MKRIASRPLRRAVFPVALLSVLAYGSACFHHHDVPAVRPGGHSRHIATRGTLPPDFLDLVTTKKAFADLATVMPDGSPQVTPIWFDFTGGKIRINTARGRVKDRNMSKNARVALAIMDPDNAYRHIQIRGRISNVTEQGADQHIDSLAKKY